MTNENLEPIKKHQQTKFIISKWVFEIVKNAKANTYQFKKFYNIISGGEQFSRLNFHNFHPTIVNKYLNILIKPLPDSIN